MTPHVVHIRDYTRTPGARYISEGMFSGEHFRTTVLSPAFKRARDAGADLMVDFDGVISYGTSFLEEAFGGLQREYSSRLNVAHHLRFKCDKKRTLQRVQEYLRLAWARENGAVL